MNKIFFLIGSSGSGKTTVAKIIESQKVPNIMVLYSDSVKPPTFDEMVKEYGSTEEWQKNNTKKWVKEIKEKYLINNNVLFDIQSRPSFIEEACKNNGLLDYKIILFDCSDEERKRRLIESRNQPELATDRMMDWARYLREKCTGGNCQIIDNTNMTTGENTKILLNIVISK